MLRVRATPRLCICTRAGLRSRVAGRWGRGVELDGRCQGRGGVPRALPAPGALLRGFEEGGLAVGDPVWAAFEIGAEEVAHALCVFESLGVDGKGGKDLEDAVEQDPTTESGFAGGHCSQISAEFELFESFDQSRT